MSQSKQASVLEHEDERLVELVTEALVDPNLHTDLRMRLHEEISDILKHAHEQVYGPGSHPPYEEPVSADQSKLPEMLTSVLIDPNIHTDARMRLHAEIPALLETARHHAQVGPH